jgi:hypothetical protein
MQALGRLLRTNLRHVILACIGCNIFLWIFMYFATRSYGGPYQWVTDIRAPKCGTWGKVPQLDSEYEPHDEVAWAIPVGGR